MEDENMDAIIYTRYSPSGSNKDTSLATQEDLCRKACELQGWNVVGVFKDKAKSGRSMSGRVGFSAAMEAALKFKGILVAYDLTRISRSTVDGLKLFNRLEEGGAGVYIVSGACRPDTTQPHWKLVMTLLLSLGEYQAELNREKTIAGLKRRAERGLPLGERPFGDMPGEKEELHWLIWRRYNGWSASALAAELRFRGRKHRVRAGYMCWWSASAIGNLYRRFRNEESEWEKTIAGWHKQNPDEQPGFDNYDVYVNRMLPEIDMSTRTHPKDGHFCVPMRVASQVLTAEGKLKMTLPEAAKVIRDSLHPEIPEIWKIASWERLTGKKDRRILDKTA